jgi:hypothetical protein
MRGEWRPRLASLAPFPSAILQPLWRRKNEYGSLRIVAELPSCTVSYRDMEGITRYVDVSASSLYEAAVLGMNAFEQTGWADHPVGAMEIVVKSPAVKHLVPVAKVTNWLSRVGNPRDSALKARLRAILGWND